MIGFLLTLQLPQNTEENAATQDNLEVLERSWHPAQTWRLFSRKDGRWLDLLGFSRKMLQKFAADLGLSGIYCTVKLALSLWKPIFSCKQRPKT